METVNNAPKKKLFLTLNKKFIMSMVDLINPLLILYGGFLVAVTPQQEFRVEHPIRH